MDENERMEKDVISLLDEDGKEHEFEIVDALELEGKQYLALVPLYDESQAEEALEAGQDPAAAVIADTLESLGRRYRTMQLVGDHLEALIPEGGTILTQCYGETIIGTLIRAARRLRTVKI